MPRDAFGIGGILIREEDKEAAKDAHAKFCETWKIDYPLHSSEIRHQEENFNWLVDLDANERKRFFDELSEMLLSVPVVGHACIVHRPGYDKRYREQYAGGTWHLCKTAFSVIVERAAKLTINEKRQLIIYPEYGDPTANRMLRSYYKEIKNTGMPFDEATSAKYEPLSQAEFASTLLDFSLKPKSNPLIQIADLYLYPIRRAGYDLTYLAHDKLIERKKLINCLLSSDEIPMLGIKYSCFEDVVKT